MLGNISDGLVLPKNLTSHRKLAKHISEFGQTVERNPNESAEQASRCSVPKIPPSTFCSTILMVLNFPSIFWQESYIWLLMIRAY